MVRSRRDDRVVAQRQIARDTEGRLTNPTIVHVAIGVPIVDLPTLAALPVLADDVNLHPLPCVNVDVNPPLLALT